MNSLTLVLITVIATLAVANISFVIYRNKKEDPEQKFKELFGKSWEQIRPILSELFINVFNIYQADKKDFEGLLDFSVKFVKEKINESEYLLPEEKELFTEDLIKELIRPKLRELYEQEINEKQ